MRSLPWESCGLQLQPVWSGAEEKEQTPMGTHRQLVVSPSYEAAVYGILTYHTDSSTDKIEPAAAGLVCVVSVAYLARILRTCLKRETVGLFVMIRALNLS